MSEDQAETDAFTDVRLEYGVVEDRTSRGLGHCLLATYSTPGMAAWRVDERLSAGAGYAVAVKVRTVATTEWRALSASPAWREPPPGWVSFGALVDHDGPAECSDEVGDDGLPLWERAVPPETAGPA